MFPIEMKHIGKIDAVGTVQVFGYSARRVDEHVADYIYLSYAGPATAADAVWASLIERRALDFTDLAGKPHRLRHGGYPGLEGNEAPFKRFVTRIEHLALDHCILLDKRFFQPAYDFETSLTFVFAGDNLADKVGQHVSQCVDIAVFPEWHAGLLALGRRERLVTPLMNWAHPVYQVTLDRARWTQVIALAVEREELTWPGEQPSDAAKHLLESQTRIEAEQNIAQARQPNQPGVGARPPHPPAIRFVRPIALDAQARPIPAPGSTREAPHAGAPSARTPAAPIARSRIPRSRPYAPPIFQAPPLPENLGIVLPDTLAAQDWTISGWNGVIQARGPQGSTRSYTLSHDTSLAEAAAIRDQIIHEIEKLSAATEMPKAPHAEASFTLTQEGGWTWISFERKPADWVLARLKSAGFRWGQRRRAWYSRKPVTREAVERLIA